MSELRNQVMWNRLISIVEEQALALVRTAFSTSVREAGDLSAGVYDAEGRMIAQAVTGTPGHVNTMAAAVANFIEDIGPHRIYEGDSYITNDPWKGTGHLHDFTVVNPVFRNGTLVAFFACTAHVVDVGGRGYGPDATEVYEEGLFVPIMKQARWSATCTRCRAATTPASDGCTPCSTSSTWRAWLSWPPSSSTGQRPPPGNASGHCQPAPTPTRCA